MRSIARRAALIGAEVVLHGQPPVVGDAKGLPGDWVTNVDVAAERAIAAWLAEQTPEIPVQGEELGGALEGLRWVVDPLDGTTNFVHGFPAVGVSVALVQDDRAVAGAIAAPFLGDLWHGSAGGGALWERPGGSARTCHVSTRAPRDAVVATGFPFRHKERLPRYLNTMKAALDAFEDLRRPGAASLDLAWTACGVFDGFFELGLAAWDVAAGALLVHEAGGVVTDWGGGPQHNSGDILAAPPQVHAGLLAMAPE